MTIIYNFKDLTSIFVKLDLNDFTDKFKNSIGNLEYILVVLNKNESSLSLLLGNGMLNLILGFLRLVRLSILILGKFFGFKSILPFRILCSKVKSFIKKRISKDSRLSNFNLLSYLGGV